MSKVNKQTSGTCLHDKIKMKLQNWLLVECVSDITHHMLKSKCIG